jgi:hypothetical protein
MGCDLLKAAVRRPSRNPFLRLPTLGRPFSSSITEVGGSAMFARQGFLFTHLYWLAIAGGVGVMAVGSWLVEANGGGGWKIFASSLWFLGPMAAAALLAQSQRRKMIGHAERSNAADSR